MRKTLKVIAKAKLLPKESYIVISLKPGVLQMSLDMQYFYQEGLLTSKSAVSDEEAEAYMDSLGMPRIDVPDDTSYELSETIYEIEVSCKRRSKSEKYWNG